MNKNPHAVALGRLGGKSRSEKKLAAIAKNAKKPRKKIEPNAGSNPFYSPI